MNGSLYLFPEDPLAAPEPEQILTLLRTLEVIGAPFAQGPCQQVFLAGDGFPRHVIFAGCSPHLRFEPADEQDCDFCHVALLGPYEHPRLITGRQTRSPRCPHCQTRLPHWQAALSSPAAAVTCPSCHQGLTAATLDWRQQAAIGRVLLEFRNVFPGEAVPGDRLTRGMAEVTDLPWRYGWTDMSTVLTTTTRNHPPFHPGHPFESSS